VIFSALATAMMVSDRRRPQSGTVFPEQGDPRPAWPATP
jgi:hypothetical protein